MSSILEEPSVATENEAESKVKHLYEACIDEAAVIRRDVEPLIQFVDDLGGWPIVSDTFDEENWILEEVLARIRQFHNTNYLFKHQLMKDVTESSQTLIFLDQPDLGMKSREDFLRDKSDRPVTAYIAYMISIVKELRPKLNDSYIAQEMNAAYDFEREIANASLPKAQRRNYLEIYNKTTIQNLGRMAPQINWFRYLSLVFNDGTLTESEQFNTLNLPYLIQIADVVSRTPKRVVANFLMWRVTMRSMDYLCPRLLYHRLEYRKVVDGDRAAEPRWKTCVKRCKGLMSSAVGAMFIRRHFDEQSKIEAKMMVHDIRGVLLDTLEDTDWMDDDTKQEAVAKATATYDLIGYDETLKNNESVNKEFKDVNITRHNHFENIVELWKNGARQMVAQRKTKFDGREDLESPVTVNAYYLNNYNRMYFPAGILQPPFYFRHNLKAMNYGGIGMVIGHEMTHGFDNTGRLFDREGTLRTWFSSGSIEAFNEKKQCLIDQYSNFSTEVDGKRIHLDGSLTQGEIIADNGGLKQSYEAYRRWVGRRGEEEPQLPGLGLTNDQLFFLNFGQIWCSLYRPEALKQILASSIHPPQYFRVRGAITNSPSFAEAYKCPVGSPMNPKKKCSMW
ncbi:neprilysin-1-like [Lytechinus pictus]|uniref:neprilysin-1-like n=1 Tax=Lytechinus pictus TaxID=7653 RepID=UPI0030B9BF47